MYSLFDFQYLTWHTFPLILETVAYWYNENHVLINMEWYTIKKMSYLHKSHPKGNKTDNNEVVFKYGHEGVDTTPSMYGVCCI